MRYFPFFFLLFFTQINHAQTNKTIHELLNLNKNCSVLWDETDLSFDRQKKKKSRVDKPNLPIGSDDFSIQTYQKALITHFKSLNYTPTIESEDYLFFQNENFQWGMKDKSGKLILEPQFEYIQALTTIGRFQGLKDGKWNYYDYEGNALFKKGYYHISSKEENYIIGEEKGVGLMGKAENILIEPKFEWILQRTFEEDTFYIAIGKNKTISIFTPKNKEIILNIYPNMSNLGEFLDSAHYLIDGKIVNIETGENLICDEKYYIRKIKGNANAFTVNYKSDSEYFIINKRGELLTEEVFVERPKFEDGCAIVKQKTEEIDYNGRAIKKTGVIDEYFYWVVEPVYESVFTTDFERVFHIENNKQQRGYIDANNNILIPLKYQTINFKEKEQHIVARNLKANPPLSDVYSIDSFQLIAQNYKLDSFGQIITNFVMVDSTKGKEVYYKSPASYDWRIFYNNEMKPISDTIYGRFNKFGDIGYRTKRYFKSKAIYKFYDFKGTPITLRLGDNDVSDFKSIKTIRKNYYLITRMNEESYIYSTKGEFGFFVEKNIKEAVFFEDLSLFAFSSSGHKTGLISSKGKEVLPAEFSTFYHHPKRGFNDGLMTYRFDRKNSGIIKWTGEPILTDYGSVKLLRYHFYSVAKNGRKGVVTLQNKVIVPLEYQKVENTLWYFKATTFDGEIHQYGMDGKRL